VACVDVWLIEELWLSQHNHAMRLPSVRACALAALSAAGCSPELNWREARSADAEIVAMFPCKPQRLARDLVLAGISVRMTLLSCEAGGVTYGLTHAEMRNPGQVHAAMAELRRSAALNIGAASPQRSTPFELPGMTPNPLAERWLLGGRGTDGNPIVEQVVFFSRGTRVYQATVFGAALDAQAVDSFFGGLSLPR
jgi:hypothetical protein